MSQNITNRLPRLTASDIQQYGSSSHIIHKATTSKNNGTYDDTHKMYWIYKRMMTPTILTNEDVTISNYPLCSR